MRASRRRVQLIALVAALGALLALATWASGVLDRQERNTIDARFAVRGDRPAPPDIVVVGIDGDTTGALGRWPFPRDVQGRIIRAVAAAGPRAIGYDIELADLTDEAADNAILDAIDASRPIVLATTALDDAGDPGLFIDADSLREAGVGVGMAAFPGGSAPGGVIRLVPYEVEGLPSFAVAVAEAATGRRVDQDGFGDDGAVIDFRGPADTVRIIPAIDVLRGRAGDALRGRIVIIGTTDARLGDAGPVPVGDAPMAGPEINANAVATILDGVPLRHAPGWLDVVLVMGLAALGGAAAVLRRGWITGLALAAAGAAYLLAAQAAFATGLILDVVHPLLALGVAGVGGLALNVVLLERDRFRLRSEFARFVPAAVVDEVIGRAGADQRLGGRRVYSTVMFADLRGFTGAAERLTPEAVIEMLNRYLTEMSDAILDHGGTLVSYQGDGIMAIFGAPIEQPDHADRAVAAAREMVSVRLASFNAWYTARGYGEPFRMGVGLASGPVMSGNVGSERRMEYAAVGDTTNMAARLQGLTKETPHMVLLADTTRGALTRPAPDLAAVGSLDVRGRQLPAAVWTLATAGGGDGAPPSGTA